MNRSMFSSRSNSNRSSHPSPVSSATTPANQRSSGQISAKKQTALNGPNRAGVGPGNQAEKAALLRQKAIARARQGEYAEAIALYDLLIDCDPVSASNYNNRGLMHFQNGQLEQALADYNRAIQLNPKLAKVYNNRANCYASLGELEAAIADYETAIDLNPANIHAWINQGITFRDLGLYEQAIENLDLALQVNQLLQGAEDAGAANSLVGHIYAERGRAYHLAGDWNCAVADYKRALTELSPLDAPAVSRRLRSQVEGWLHSLLDPLSL